MGEKTCTELVVRSVSPPRHSPNGHPYVECLVDGGVVAVWGSSGNMGHIETVSGTKRPFRIICDCIPSRWQHQDLWVYERPEIYSIEPLSEGTLPQASAMGTDPEISVEELSTWRRTIVRWVTALEHGRSGSTDGLSHRIAALSFSGDVPREIAALMKAVTEMRNAAEYKAKVLSKVESLAVRNAWLAISEWAAVKGLGV